MKQFNSILGNKDAIQECLDFTREVIQDIFKPKCIVCFSIPGCFENLNRRYKFSNIQTIRPKTKENNDATIVVKKGEWGNIPVYGISHPSGRISWENLGAIAHYLKEEMQLLGI